jgi:hypothetical protein
MPALKAPIGIIPRDLFPVAIVTDVLEQPPLSLAKRFAEPKPRKSITNWTVLA